MLYTGDRKVDAACLLAQIGQKHRQVSAQQPAM